MTKRVVENAPLPESGQAFYRDNELKGFALRVTASGVRSFIVEKRINGRSRRITLGRFPELTAEAARRAAYRHLGTIAEGEDPVALKREAHARTVTVGECFEAFLKTRRNLRPQTLRDYEGVMRRCFPDWQRKELTTITKDKVAQRHAQLGETRGPAEANYAMRVLRAVFNYAQARYEDRHGNPIVLDNPVNRLTRTRSWYRIERRRTVIKAHQLPAWFEAVESLRADGAQGDLVADYLTLLLLTGLRRSEAAGLTWQHVDRQQETLTIPDTKNREPLTLPVSNGLDAILENRAKAENGPYVFAGRDGQSSLVEPKRQIRKVIERSGVTFTIHDLRRTFITVAESLDIPAYAIKRLVNHKMSGDVTAGYIITDVERLRRPMQQITDYLLKCAGIQATAAVVPLKAGDALDHSSGSTGITR